MAVLAGVLDHHLGEEAAIGAGPGREPSSGASEPVGLEEVADGAAALAVGEATLQDLAAVAQMLATTLDRSTASHAAVPLTPAVAREVRAVVEQHYEEHHRTADGAQVALGRRLERLVRTLRTEALSPTA